MSFNEFEFFSSPGATFGWLTLLVLFLYMAKDPAHKAIRSVSRVLSSGFKLASKGLLPMEQRLALRNREVLLAAGREEKERIMEREFERISSAAKKELADSPSLHRKISEVITKLEDDYKLSTDVPPSPPGWINAVDAVAKIPAKDDPVVRDILDDIHDSLIKAHNTATEEYRTSRKERHQLLKNMLPSWRKMLHSVDIANTNVTSLLERAKVIDRHMDDYEQILNGTDRAVRMLSSSSINQFFISSFVLAIALGGAMINFHLIARPMAEMVGGNTYIFSTYKVADIAALVIILVEITMGLFLMESLRITRLFPAINALKDHMRVRMIWVTFSILLALATVEAGLAYMRELLMQDQLATSALLRGEAMVAVENSFTWITTVAQMGMGFILPFALVFVAIPAETFVSSLRTVLGVLAVGTIRSISFILRLFANSFHFVGNTSVHIYDLFIFAPLWIENQIKSRSAGPKAVVSADRRKVDPPELVKEAS